MVSTCGRSGNVQPPTLCVTTTRERMVSLASDHCGSSSRFTAETLTSSAHRTVCASHIVRLASASLVSMLSAMQPSIDRG